MFLTTSCVTNAKGVDVVESLHLSSVRMWLVFSTIVSSAGLLYTAGRAENSTSRWLKRALIGPELCLLGGARRAQASRRSNWCSKISKHSKNVKISAEITNSSQDGSLPRSLTHLSLWRVVRAGPIRVSFFLGGGSPHRKNCKWYPVMGPGKQTKHAIQKRSHMENKKSGRNPCWLFEFPCGIIFAPFFKL